MTTGTERSRRAALPAYLDFLIENDVLFVLGTLAALVWANADAAGYAASVAPLHRPVNDVLMALFFAVATKEIRLALAPGGALGSPARAALPLAATVGGMAGPALVYVLVARALGQPELGRGWAIPCATDIAFAYLVARAVFGASHPAIPFLLLLSIADDAGGLLVLAVFYPHGEVHAWPFALVGAAVLLCLGLRRLGLTSWWLHVGGAGALSWVGLDLGGLHPALALVPVVLAMPAGEPLEAMERALAVPVACVLAAFGVVNGGVPLGHVGPATLSVVVGLIAGKPLGISLGAGLALLAGLRLPDGFRGRDLVVLGVTAGTGFTVALFVATVAFPVTDPALDAAKMGALASLGAAPLALFLGRALGVERKP